MFNLSVRHAFWNLPVQNGALKRLVQFFHDGQQVYEFDIELAEGEPDFWTFLDLAPWQGQDIEVRITPPLEGGQALPGKFADAVQDEETFYHETLRPRYHFTARRGWHNDPNGLVYYQGTYHLFFQHNPFGIKWGNMHWGHAVSPDLLHWREQPEVLLPDAQGTMFSGSAVVDWENTSGFQTGADKPLVLIYTAAGGTSPWSQDQAFTQCLAFSVDGGQSWQKYKENPVVPNLGPGNRDPKVIWHAPTKRWIMALYLGVGSDFCLLASPDLKRWERILDYSFPASDECPDIFELPVDGDPTNTRWVLWGANASYQLGQFDGHTYTPESVVNKSHFEGSSYAAQSWSDLPAEDGRRIQLSWLRGDIVSASGDNDMPFNQQMGIPVELTLRTTSEGIRLFSEPVRELESLRAPIHTLPAQTLKPAQNPLEGITVDAMEIRAEIKPGTAETVQFSIRGIPLVYDARGQVLTCQGKTAPLSLEDGEISLQILVDRASLEIFGNHGRVYLPLVVSYAEQDQALELFAYGGSAEIASLEINELKSIWE